MTTTYLAKDRFNHAIQCLAPGTTQTVSISGSSSATSNALGKDTVVIRVLSTTNCFIKIGTGTPTATTADTPLTASVPEYFRVDGSQTLKVAGIQMSGSGSLYITEML
jgi:hypothetical protein